MAQIATSFHLQSYLVVRGVDLQLVLDESQSAIVVSKTLVNNCRNKYFGQRLIEGDIIHAGLIWNMGAEDLIFIDRRSNEEYIVYAGEMLAIGKYIIPDHRSSLTGSTQSCSVTCEGNFVACCNYGPPPRCRCVSDIPVPQCDVGGIGTQSCSVSTSEDN